MISFADTVVLTSEHSTSLLLALTEVISLLKKKYEKIRLISCTLSEMISNMTEKDFFDQIRRIFAKIKKENISTIHSFIKNIADPKKETKLLKRADTVIDLKTKEEKLHINKMLRISKNRGYNYHNRWLYYKICGKKVVVDFTGAEDPLIVLCLIYHNLKTEFKKILENYNLSNPKISYNLNLSTKENYLNIIKNKVTNEEIRDNIINLINYIHSKLEREKPIYKLNSILEEVFLRHTEELDIISNLPQEIKKYFELKYDLEIEKYNIDEFE